MARVGAAKVQKRISVLLCHHIVPLTTKLLFLILTPYLVITVVRLHYYRSLHCRTILQSHFAINRQTKRKPINLTVVSVATQCILSRANLSGSSQNNKCAPNWSQFMFTVSPLIEDNIFSSSSLSVKKRNEKNQEKCAIKLLWRETAQSMSWREFPCLKTSRSCWANGQ